MVGSFFTMLFAKITAVLSWFSALFVAIFVSIWDVVKDAFSWLFDQVLSVATSAITAIDVSGLSNVNGFGSVPADVLNIMALIGVGKAITIITAAIGIRFALQLIPFVRLGS